MKTKIGFLQYFLFIFFTGAMIFSFVHLTFISNGIVKDLKTRDTSIKIYTKKDYDKIIEKSKKSNSSGVITKKIDYTRL